MVFILVLVIPPSNSSSLLRVPDGLRQQTSENMSITNNPTPNAPAPNINGDIGRVPMKSTVTELLADDDPALLGIEEDDDYFDIEK